MTFLAVVAVSCGHKDSEKFLLKPQAFQQKMATTEGAIILDVRTPEEVNKEYLKGAINFNFNAEEFKVLIAGMDKTKTYFVYCASGVRSGKAADMMRDMDFQQVYLLEGGLKAWKAEGLATQALGRGR
jgi:rhodanese-related sulfurtransferase